jgi:hypothetical protein
MCSYHRYSEVVKEVVGEGVRVEGEKEVVV